MKQILILKEIDNDIDNLNLTSIQKKRAKLLCAGIMNNINTYNNSLYTYTKISTNDLLKYTKQKNIRMFYIIKKELLRTGILITDGIFVNNIPGKDQECLGYMFNLKYTDETFALTSIKTKEEIKPKVKEIDLFKVKETLNRIVLVDEDSMRKELETRAETPSYKVIKKYFGEKTFMSISEMGDIQDFDYTSLRIARNNNIIEYQTVYNLYKKAHELKEETNTNVELIFYKNRAQLLTEREFLKQAKNNMLYHNLYRLEDIKLKNFRASRNTTNNRLDTTLTNLESCVIDYLRLDGERLIELDIVNSQFAYASYLNPNIDENFKELTKTGKLYEFISNEYDITREEAKQLMFRISFDKPRKKYQRMHDLFPLFMEWNNTVKKETRYQDFSNKLAQTESRVMIDGLLSLVLESGYSALSIHDSLRVKESEYEIIREIMVKYFKEIGFECTIKNKTTL